MKDEKLTKVEGRGSPRERIRSAAWVMTCGRFEGRRPESQFVSSIRQGSHRQAPFGRLRASQGIAGHRDDLRSEGRRSTGHRDVQLARQEVDLLI